MLQLSTQIYSLVGIAACNVGGVTIHSFGGIGIGADSLDGLVSKVQKNKKATARWLRTKVLIIDEGQIHDIRSDNHSLTYLSPVSMVDGDLFDKLAQIGSRIRKNPAPFGGIQVRIPTFLSSHTAP